MLTTQARAAVVSAKGSRKVSFVVLVHATDQFGEISLIQDRLQRSNKLKNYYREAKKPFIDILAEYANIGLRVINNLDGTPNLIASGPASAWRKLFDEKVAALKSPNFEFIPNTPDWSSDP